MGKKPTNKEIEDKYNKLVIEHASTVVSLNTTTDKAVACSSELANVRAKLLTASNEIIILKSTRKQNKDLAASTNRRLSESTATIVRLRKRMVIMGEDKTELQEALTNAEQARLKCNHEANEASSEALRRETAATIEADILIETVRHFDKYRNNWWADKFTDMFDNTTINGVLNEHRN